MEEVSRILPCLALRRRRLYTLRLEGIVKVCCILEVLFQLPTPGRN
jgi:hypothetical protein